MYQEPNRDKYRLCDDCGKDRVVALDTYERVFEVPSEALLDRDEPLICSYCKTLQYYPWDETDD